MLTILQLKQYLGQKLAPKDNDRQEKNSASKECKEISTEITSRGKEGMGERRSSHICSFLFTKPLLFILNLTETPKQQ